MQLLEIDKQRYRKHLNRVIAACIVALIIGSLGISQALIALFPDPSGSHFHWNLTGVIVTSVFIGFSLRKYKSHPYMEEVSYIWDLKQILNRINRKMLKLKAAAEQGNINAMIAIQYSYAGSRLLWQLDDNTIVMEDLAIEQAKLDSIAAKYNVSPKAEDFNVSMLDEF